MGSKKVKSFKPGDRVRVRAIVYSANGPEFYTAIGTVLEFREPIGTVSVHIKGMSPYWCYWRQCTRLKPKPRRIWVQRADGGKSETGSPYQYWSTDISNTSECLQESDFTNAVEFVEVLKREKT